ncbi:SDR family NAD(P)-dependent oxidoreductase [Nocardiopsis sp. JB363]|uniref:SDR family NAD(P)-dependent oxidoreductase n=1 Tax=Nocardiopsis sp. JB363 TaxID=1434837 RepID=UPI00097B5A0D|nr:SDR family NAD(P)-dependent oxidoreductase [Nocardiopsis sp. JB363]SIO88010.1 oxidoreductase, short-chain dehydrogenase/reductase family [Nocardiopsis sp. JB363]
MTGLDGKNAIVTGAGSGIGRATALQLAEAGARVLVADLNADGTRETVEQVRAAGGTAESVVGDLSDPKVVAEVVATALDRFGGIDVLVNNAGIMDDMSATADVSDQVWERVIRVNVTAPFLLTRAVLPHMTEKQKGSIVFTASEAALRGGASGTAYTASKHAVVGLVKSTAIMYRDQGVRVNAVAPGGVATGISVQADPEAMGPGVLGRYMGNMGAIAESGQLASAIVFLASEAASNVNGVILPVDGGWSAV